MFLAPVCMIGNAQEAAGSVPTQLFVPSDTVTVPVGTPPPGDVTATAYVTVTGSPVTVGSGRSEEIATEVAAVFTVCATPADTLVRKFASPAYVAVNVLAPAVVDTSPHDPAATVATQVSVPSLTVTEPVGVPAPGAVTLSVKATGTVCPVTDGSGRSEVMLIVVAAAVMSNAALFALNRPEPKAFNV